MGQSLFAYGFEFAKIFDYELGDFGHIGVKDTAVAKNDPQINRV
jgi:hypothetical protein